MPRTPRPIPRSGSSRRPTWIRSRDRVRGDLRLPRPRVAGRPARRRRGRHRRQPDRPSRPLRGDQAGPRGRPPRLQREAAGPRAPPRPASSSSLRPPAGLRLGCSPSTFLGEAQQTAAALIRGGRLGTVRAVYAEVNWGRIETWHPAPAPFFDVGGLVDVGVYPLTLVTTMLGRAPGRSGRGAGTCMPDRDDRRRARRSGSAARTSSWPPSSSTAARSCASRRASTSAARPARPAASSSTATTRRSRSAASRTSTRRSRSARTAEALRARRRYVRPPYRGIAWARGVAEMAARSPRAGRTGRAREQAAHVVDILEGAARSIGGRWPAGRRSSRRFEPPPLMPWATEAAEAAS